MRISPSKHTVKQHYRRCKDGKRRIVHKFTRGK